ncbi:ThuA domain-containing protein [Akkermansiaceae bacterium]|nr:ThuA domain-containing protein [Akkermansiaceae bacterium]MDA7898459.1 ThuA domain-containing protein [bacterium]MDA7519278.1 ThuA domain-containing protein [Akkermansiaceae bacterium]MDA7651168.1 ThuA domain-containing protein [Akkermansiaceae bacterium]MDA7863730.1 ThuA domain-containing protein [Akkermansiaceae bacterium]
MKKILTLTLALAGLFSPLMAQEKNLFFEGSVGPGKGKHIVLVSGDEEYRSEESMPMLAKILSKKHGFDCTVLFSWSKDGNYIDPNNAAGVVGWDKLDSADLMIIGTRMRNVDEAGRAHMVKYLNAGKPVAGFRTATHAFKGKEGFGNISQNDWGLKILGEKWVNHHGKHKGQGARGIAEKGNEKHAVLNGVKNPYGPSDVYGVVHLTEGDTILLRGEVTETLAPDSPRVKGKQNEPMMPLAWMHTYTAPDGKTTGEAFCTTMGASVDFLDESLRRLLVNASYSLLELKVPETADVAFVDPFYPSFYGFWNGGNAKIWKERALVAEDFGMGKVTETLDPKGTPAWPHRPARK